MRCMRVGDRGREESEGNDQGTGKGERERDEVQRVGDRGREESEGDDQGTGKGEREMMHESGR